MAQEECGIEDLAILSNALKNVRTAADEEARNAIDLVEKRLEAALAGETMRGLPDLGDRVFGLRVEVEGSMYAKLPPNGRAVLVVAASGKLVLASRHGKTAFVQAPPRAAVVASLLIPYMRVVREVLRIHLASAETRRARFQHILDLAGRITSALL